MPSLTELVRHAQEGDREAYGRVVEVTTPMAYSVAYRVLRDPGLAEDACQESYLRAYRRLGELRDPAAFAGWLRRIVVTVASNMRRAHRATWLPLNDALDVPVLDEAEGQWSEAQRRTLARALFNLTPAERRLCDRRYHGGWSVTRLAADAGVDEAAIRKRLQRVRDKLRREMEMSEQQAMYALPGPAGLSERILELLARPRLTDLPENPVGKTQELIRSIYADCLDVQLPEIVDFAESQKTIGNDALYIDPNELHFVDDRRVLRYDLTLPLLLNTRFEGRALRLWSAGKVYRHCATDATHLDAFHQAEVFWMDDQQNIDLWRVAGQVLASVNLLLPECTVRIMPTQYPMCRQAWELEAEHHGRSLEVLAWGIYTDRIIASLGGDPQRHAAVGVGYGLERLSGLRYDIDDIRKIEVATVS
jgi:RNA polymerase sigma factor (sigma-70 family)